ncbi:MAG: hypothetical protein PHG35_02245 [Dehalococcoidales bacterium]|nr:hypothetical protein [Dehalococcoidales bacterium]
MCKKAAIAVLLFAMVFSIFGCTSGNSDTATTTKPASIEYIRESKLANIWQMKQIQLNFTNETSITIELAAGDKVDGYFYVVGGGTISFTISGLTQIYASSNGTTSDRFSFTASQEQGIDYKLKFTVGSGDTSVFLEIIYPVTGSVLVPIGTK